MFKRKNRNRLKDSSDQEFILGPATAAAEFLLRESLTKEKIKPYGYEEDDFTHGLEMVLSHFDIPENPRVIYPGSSEHMGVAFVFDKSQVTHVDPSKEACDALSDEGCIAIESSFEYIEPDEQFDILIALNSYGSPDGDTLARVLKPNALIIANNYTHWAHELQNSGVVKLEGALFPAYYGNFEPKYTLTDELPADATGVTIAYYNVTPEGRMSSGTPEQHTFSDLDPRYPDALFAFRYTPH